MLPLEFFMHMEIQKSTAVEARKHERERERECVEDADRDSHNYADKLHTKAIDIDTFESFLFFSSHCQRQCNGNENVINIASPLKLTPSGKLQAPRELEPLSFEMWLSCLDERERER